MLQTIIRSYILKVSFIRDKQKEKKKKKKKKKKKEQTEGDLSRLRG